MDFTQEDFKKMKKELNLNNQDIADIIGTSLSNVKMQTSPTKPLPTWAKSMLYVFKIKTNSDS